MSFLGGLSSCYNLVQFCNKGHYRTSEEIQQEKHRELSNPGVIALQIEIPFPLTEHHVSLLWSCFPSSWVLVMPPEPADKEYITSPIGSAFDDVRWLFRCQKTWFTPITPLNVSLVFLSLLMFLNRLINHCNWKASWLVSPNTIPPNQKSRMNTLTLSPSNLTPSRPSELAVLCNPDLAAKPFTLTSPSALSIDFSFVYVHPSLSETSLPVILLFSIELSHIGMGSWGTGETNQRSNVMEAPLTLTVPILRAVTHSRVVA